MPTERPAVSRRFRSSRDSAVTADISSRLASLRLQFYRQQLNEGLQSKPVSDTSANGHPALAWLEKEAAHSDSAAERPKTAGPSAPRSWIHPPETHTSLTEEGRRERLRLRPTSIVDESIQLDPSGLTCACLRHVARLMAEGDEATLNVVYFLPIYLKQALMHVASIEAPLTAATAEALLIEPESEAVESFGSASRGVDGEEWEGRAVDDVAAEQLTQLDLRFASMNAAQLLDLLFEKQNAPRFPALAALDLSYCGRISYTTSFMQQLARLPHLAHLAIVGHEVRMDPQSGALTRLAVATPNLQSLELGAGVSFWSLQRFAWGLLWQRLDFLIIRGFRTLSAKHPRANKGDQPRAGTLKAFALPTETERAAELTVQELRSTIKQNGRARWLEILV